MSTINATNIVADALVGNTSANAITVRGEGSATTSLQQGLAKVWCRWSLSDQSSAIDSFNVASITDTGTGEGNINTTNNFSANQSCGHFSSNDWHAINGASGDSTFIRLTSANSSHSVADVSRAFLSAHGDLA